MRDRTLLAIGLLGGLALLSSTATLALILSRRAPPPAPCAAEAPRTPDAGAPAAAEASAWRPAGAGLAKAVDVAFAAGRSLATDGAQASFDPGDGSVRPVEVPAAIPHVFGASGRLFAAGENEGAPFAIVLAPGEEPLVVPLPCALSHLAGENGVVAGLCESGGAMALSSDSGKSFRSVTLELPMPPGAEDAEVERRLEAVGVSPAGAVLVASTQRWQTQTAGGALAWTLGQVTLRPAGSRFLRTANVEALAATVGVHLAGGAATLAGLQVALDGAAEGVVRPRLFRGPEGEPPVAVGTAGPACGTAAAAGKVPGVLLGTEVAYFGCGERLVATTDGGATWTVDGALGTVGALRGGDMRLFARSGERAFERRFVNRSESGATAVRLQGAVAARKEGGADAGPVAAPFGIREPVDGGEADAAGEVSGATP